MIRFSAKDISIEIDEPEDVVELLQVCLSKLAEVTTGKRSMSDAERAKKYRENKKHRDENVTKRDENVTKRDDVTEEERDEKGFSPLVPPLSFSPNTPYPITPISPLSQKAEREEEYMAGAGKRGELKPFGEYVRLSDNEYTRLCNDFGKAKADNMIRRMNSYIGEDETGKLAKKYATRNHNLTLRNWENRHEQETRAKQPKQIPKQQETTFGDINRFFETAEMPTWDIEL